MFTVEENEEKKARIHKRKVSFTLTIRTHFKSLLFGMRVVRDCGRARLCLCFLSLLTDWSLLI